MQINYSVSDGIWGIFYQFTIANRHLQVALSSPSSTKKLLKENVLEYRGDLSSLSLIGRVSEFFLAAIECFPGLGLVITLIDRFFNNQATLPPDLDPKLKKAVQFTPQFNSYSFENDPGVHLSDISTRPANLFFDRLAPQGETTRPGSHRLFQFLQPLHKVRNFIMGMSDAETLTISADGKKTHLFKKKWSEVKDMGEKNLEEYLGKNIYSLSFGEIKSLLNSQKIYVSPLIPKNFYLELKKALDADNIITLPGDDHNPLSIRDLRNPKFPYLQALLLKVEKKPGAFGFVEDESMFSFNELQDLTLYQLGAMIVKAEDYHCFIKKGYRLAERNVGDQDQLKLISASGIRGFSKTNQILGNEKHQIDYKVMKHTFKTALQAAGDGAYFVLPALGMGVWGGDPDVYWRAFLDAAMETDVKLENILVNPGHQKTKAGKYLGCTGTEFALILNEYLNKHPKNQNLRKIINLFHYKSDLLLLAKNLKKQFPEKTIALVNASDPDVTLGYHVGEYVNNVCHASTTEENFAAAGTSGLNFEKITNVLNDKKRVIQAQ